MPKSALLLAAALPSLLLAACDDPRPIRLSRSETSDTGGLLKAVTQLECPEHQGPLTRVRTAPDGLSCDYSGPQGAEVTLRLVSLKDGEAKAVLTPLEAELNRLMPGVAEKLKKASAEQARAQARAQEAEAEARRAEIAAEKAELAAERAQALAERAEALAEGDAARAEEAWARAERAADQVRTKDEEEVRVSMPGMRVDAQGEDASVHLPGIHIETKGEKADVRIGPMTIRADDSSGNVEISADDSEITVRDEGDASEIRTLKRTGGTRASYVLVDEASSNQGWRLVGYEARGPEGGPLVIAVVKAKDRRENAVFNAAKDLVKRNAGG